jgi:uncharacterized membrane protein
MTTSATTAPAAVFRKLTVREALVLLVLAWLIPFLVHLAPWSGARPLGAYLLPVFWATFVAVYFYGTAAGLMTGLFTPALNLLVTGQPEWRMFGSISLELVAFVLVAAWIVRRAPRFWLLAPLAYAVAKTVAALVLSAAGTFGTLGAAQHFFSHLLAGGAAGLVALALINAALVKAYPKTAA